MDSTYIRRPLYIDRISPFIGKPVIKVLTGQRRVGKSYMMLQLIDEIRLIYSDANIIYINIELFQFSMLRSHTDLHQYVETKLDPQKPNFLLIDEIQEVESFEICLRSLLAAGTCDIYCTGSNARILSGELATMISGRYVNFPIYSLSYTEFLDFHGLENSNENLVKYMQVGGMPFLIHTGLSSDVVFEYLKNVNATIVLKDVVAREHIRNVAFLENLIAYLADNTGNVLSALNISKYLKSQQQNVPVQTILNYLRALINSFFVHKVQRADIRGLKVFEVGEKYYFEDLGLRNAVRPFNYRDEVNKLMENVVFLHLKRKNYKVFVGKQGDKEIDFLAEKDGERVYLQVTYMLFDQQTIDREFGNLLTIGDHYPKYVITMDEDYSGRSFKGIQKMHLRDFLTNY